MRYQFISVHRLAGIATPTDKLSAQVLDDGGVREAYLTGDIDDVVTHLELKRAIGDVMLRRFAGQRLATNRTEEVALSLQRVVEARRRLHPPGVFLVYRATGEADLGAGERADWGDFDVLLTNTSPASAGTDLTAGIDGIIAAISVRHENVVRASQVAAGRVFFDRERPVYAVSLTFSGSGFVSSRLSEETITFVRESSRTIEGSPTASRVSALLRKGLDADEDDELLRFLSTWASLEVLVKRVYKELALPGGTALPDQFVRVAKHLLPSEDVDHEIDIFRRVYRQRNLVYHEGILPATYPLDEITTLMRKYFRRYVETLQAPSDESS